MAQRGESEMKQTYGELWDQYVSDSFPRLRDGSPGELSYPGEEWGSTESWRAIFNHMFVPADVKEWQYAIEIGGGGGKYTERVLRANNQVRVWNFDVSKNFLDTAAARLTKFVEADRLMLHEIDPVNPDAMLRIFEREGLVRQV